MRGLYSGFSTRQFEDTGTFAISDFDVIEEDIKNHIYTQKGTRIRNPRWGTEIPSLLFEPLDREMLLTLEEELMAVVKYDPRVSLRDLVIDPDYERNMVSVTMTLLLIEFNMLRDINVRLYFGGGV